MAWRRSEKLLSEQKQFNWPWMINGLADILQSSIDHIKFVYISYVGSLRRFLKRRKNKFLTRPNITPKASSTRRAHRIYNYISPLSPAAHYKIHICTFEL